MATSGFASISRLPFGTTVGPGAAARSSEPAQTLQLFEFEACPFCRQADARTPGLSVSHTFGLHVLRPSLPRPSRDR